MASSPAPATTIDEVVSRLDAIVAECRAAGSRAGYFAALYRRVTVAVREGIGAGRFDDGPRMERLDVVFANRYLEAYAAFGARRPVSRSWDLALQAGRRSDLVVLQHLLLGMNAHINLDLGIAAAEVAPGAALAGLRGDFLRINEVLAELTGRVKGQLCAVWPLIGLLERAAGTADDVVVEFSMTRARDSAWDFAQVLARHPAEERGDLIRLRDEWTATFGRVTMEPPGLGEVLGRLLAQDEGARPARVIDILSA